MGKKEVNRIDVIAKHSIGIAIMVLLTFSGYLITLQSKEVFSSPATVISTPEPSLTPTEATKAGQIVKSSPLPIPTNSGRSIRIPIIYYHYIGKNPNPADKLRDNLSVDPDLFDQQMSYIASSGFTPITFDTMYAILIGNSPMPEKPIIITFDDGYVDFYVNAFPILRKYKLHATQFIPTGLVDTAYYLHWEQIKEMDKSGLITFQAHTVAHVDLITMSNDEIHNQLVASKKTLEEKLGKPVNFMAYPYGISNEKVWLAAKEAGYVGAAGTWDGNTESEGMIYDMPRIKIPGGISMEEFKKKI